MDKENKIIAQGKFNLISNPYKWKIILGVVAGISLILTFPCILAFTGNFGQTEGNAILGLAWIGIMFIPGFIMELIFASEKSGKPAEYTADSEKFMIREKNKPEACIYYSDVRGVTIEPLYMNPFFSRKEHVGYKVTIETAYQTVVYYYALSGPFSNTPPAEIPFAIIGENIPKREKNSEIISGDEYNANAT